MCFTTLFIPLFTRHNLFPSVQHNMVLTFNHNNACYVHQNVNGMQHNIVDTFFNSVNKTLRFRLACNIHQCMTTLKNK